MERKERRGKEWNELELKAIKGKEKKVKERKGQEHEATKGKERKGKERKGKEQLIKDISGVVHLSNSLYAARSGF